MIKINQGVFNDSIINYYPYKADLAIKIPFTALQGS